MKFTYPILFGTVVCFAHANPLTKREVTDADILNYALTLEHLEASFYEEGLKNYTHADFMEAGCEEPFYANLQQIASDEKTHEQFLTEALTSAGLSAVERCTYTFPSTDVKSFLALGSVLEGVGVSAYLGAAAHIMNDTYLTAAGSILTVEARHSSYLRGALGEIPFAQPFDNPLNFNEVYTVASPFITSCPSGSNNLPVKAFPSLTSASTGPVMSESEVHLMAGEGYEAMNATDVYAAFITVTGPVWAPLTSKGGRKFTVTIPKGVTGQSYVVLTKGNAQATDDNIVAGPAIIEIDSKTGGMGSMSMPTPSATGSMTSAPAQPTFTGAAGKPMSNIAGIFLAGVAAAVIG